MNYTLIKEILGWLLIVTSVFDAIKYTIQARKIQKEKTSKSMSRKFINFALINDIAKLVYGIVIIDFFIIGSSLLSLICMLDLWWQIYWFYPYKTRKLLGFKRPNIVLYTVNSLLPNRIRKRL
jgi:uncharacterized protein with PQ loop repeat